MTTASHSLATALWRARFASGLLECGYTTNRDTTQLFDLKIEMRDQRAPLRQFSDGRDGARLLRRRFGPRRNQRRFQRVDVVRKRGKIGVHESHGITKSAV